MITASPALINKLKSGNFERRVKIELLDKDENIIEEIHPDTISGSITVDKDSDIRRNLSMTIENINNKFTPGMGSKIWFDKKIKLYIGIKLPDGTIEWIPQGIFLLRKPVASYMVNQIPMVRLECPDKTHRWGNLINQLTISAGLNVATAITLVLDGVESKFIFDDCNETVPYELTFTQGTKRRQIVKQLADMITWDIGYDVYGYLRFKPHITNFDTSVVTWTYKHENYTLYSGSEKEWDIDEFANTILVIGASSQTSTVQTVVKDDDILSPFSTYNLGEILYVHNNGSPDPLIVDEAHALARAQYELLRRLQIVERQRITLIPNFLHEAGDIIELIEPNTLTNDKYQLLRFNIPLSSKDSMTAEVWRVRRLL